MEVCAKVSMDKVSKRQCSGHTPLLIFLVLSPPAPDWYIHLKLYKNPLKRLFVLFRPSIFFLYLWLLQHLQREKSSLNIHWLHDWHWVKRFTCFLFILTTALQERYRYLLTSRWGNVHSEMAVAAHCPRSTAGAAGASMSPSYLPGQCFCQSLSAWWCLMFLFQP